jgi:hypothetical protein
VSCSVSVASNVHLTNVCHVVRVHLLPLQVDPDRTLPGWSSYSSSSSSSSNSSNALGQAPDAATDALVLTYDVPWPVNLLVGQQQLQQYAAVFSVLLRLRQLQQQLTSQWAAINSRPGGSSSSRRPHAVSSQTSLSRAGRSSSSRRVAMSRRQSQQDDEATAAAAAAAADTLRLQQLRRWHGMALHCVSSVLGGMLSDLSGQLWVEFEASISSQPVSLPAIIAAHDKLLAAAQQVCLLPLQQQQQAEDGGSRSSTVHSQLACVVYRLVATAWQLQQQVQQLLSLTPDTTSTSSSNTSASVCGAYREGSSAGRLAQLLLQDEECWQGCAVAGATLEGLLLTLKKQLAVSRAGEVGHSMAGLAARLGLHM